MIDKAGNLFATAYLFLIFCIYPFYMKEGYVNIGEAKHEFLVYCSLGGLVILLVLSIVQGVMGIWRRYCMREAYLIRWEQVRISVTDILAALYGIEITVSYLLSDHRQEALWGTEGWRMGLVLHRACDYLVVAQLFLQSDFLLENPLTTNDIKPRLLGHWGTCHGINVAYANLRAWFSKDEQVSRTTKLDQAAKPINPFAVGAKLVETTDQEQDTSVVDPNFSFILGPGHGFPALQANLFIDGDLEKVDPKATRNAAGIAYVCRNFSWPDGFPSHASPFTPGVICEGGELGYALGAAYGYVLGHPERTVAVMLGDGGTRNCYGSFLT